MKKKELINIINWQADKLEWANQVSDGLAKAVVDLQNQLAQKEIIIKELSTKNSTSESEKHFCASCECSGDNWSLTYTTNPYDEEIYGNFDKDWYCEVCLEQSAKDI